MQFEMKNLHNQQGMHKSWALSQISYIDQYNLKVVGASKIKILVNKQSFLTIYKIKVLRWQGNHFYKNCYSAKI